MHAMFGRTSGGLREPLDRLDADHCETVATSKPAPGVAEVVLHGFDIEPAGNLLGRRHGVFAAGDLEEAAALEFFFERFALRLGAFEQGVGVTEFIGKRFVRKVVES